MMLVIADLVLLLHAGYAAFVIGGLLLVPVGGWCHWRWVRRRRFRIAHVLCTGIVAVEALLGIVCPLTWLEHVALVASGAAGYERSFMGHLLYKLLYYDAPAWMFTSVYIGVALMVLLLYRSVPPFPRLRRELHEAACLCQHEQGIGGPHALPMGKHEERVQI